jgi:predicted lipoprotein
VQDFSRAALAHDASMMNSVLAALDTPRSIAADLAAGRASLGDLTADQKQRFKAVLLRDAVLSARGASGPVLAESLGVTIGFNSRDGD